MPLDKTAYRRALALLEERGIAENGRLTTYGRSVEAMPVERQWAELLVHGGDELLPYLAVMASVESLHRMTRDERNLEGLVVPGSDHLTAYNLYADAYQPGRKPRDGVRSSAPRVRRGSHRAVGGAARRSGESDRGRRARDGERLSRGGRRAAVAHDAGGRRQRARVPASRRRHHAVLARDRRADDVGRRGARLEDERVRELGRDRRRLALLRRPVRQPARVDRRDAAAERRRPRVRDDGRSRRRVRRRASPVAAHGAAARRVPRVRARAGHRAD